MNSQLNFETRACKFNVEAIPGYWKALDVLGAPDSPRDYYSGGKCSGRKNLKTRLIGEMIWNQQSFFKRQGEF